MLKTDVIPSLSTHILDLTSGKPAINVQVELYQLEQNQQWYPLDQQRTGKDGRINQFKIKTSKQHTTRWYKLKFYTAEYYSPHHCFYPYIEVVFQLDFNQLHYHIPLTLSPFGYSTYRGC